MLQVLLDRGAKTHKMYFWIHLSLDKLSHLSLDKLSPPREQELDSLSGTGNSTHLQL